MNVKITLLLVITSIALSACATPEQRCERRANAPYNDLQSRIAETELNIGRGYAIEITFSMESETRYAFNPTTGAARNYNVAVRRKITTQVPIDPIIEQKKLGYLQLQVSAAATQRDSLLAACRISL